MGKGPGHFSDIGKKARDVLTRDYNYEQKFSVTRYSEAGQAFTFGLKKGDIFSVYLTTRYKFQNATVDVKLDTGSAISTTITLDQLIPHAKTILSFKIPDQKFGKVGLQYLHDHVHVSSSIGLRSTPILKFSGTHATGKFLLGGAVTFDVASGTLSKCTVGVGFSMPEFSAAFILADTGDIVKASYMHIVNPDTNASVAAEITHKFSTDENTITVGSSHSLGPLTTFKTRIHSHGKLGALIQHEWRPKSFITISGEYDTKALDNSVKLGLVLALKP